MIVQAPIEYRESFDFLNDDHMSEILDKEFAKPIQNLLETLFFIEYAERLGELDKEKALEWFIKNAREIRKTCIDEWEAL